MPERAVRVRRTGRCLWPVPLRFSLPKPSCQGRCVCMDGYRLDCWGMERNDDRFNRYRVIGLSGACLQPVWTAYRRWFWNGKLPSGAGELRQPEPSPPPELPRCGALYVSRSGTFTLGVSETAPLGLSAAGTQAAGTAAAVRRVIREEVKRMMDVCGETAGRCAELKGLGRPQSSLKLYTATWNNSGSRLFHKASFLLG